MFKAPATFGRHLMRARSPLSQEGWLRTAQKACMSTTPKVFDANGVDPRELFKTHKFACEVPMEDTDCYGIIHHANLIKYFDRARQMAFGSQRLADMEGAGVHMHVTAMNKINFSSTAALGMPLEIITNVKHITGPTIVWEQAIMKRGSDKLITSALTETSLHAWRDKQENREVATFAENGFSAVNLDHLAPVELKTCHDEIPIKQQFESTVNAATADSIPDFLFQDGVDASGRLSHLSSFRMMERSRVHWLGGARGLRRLQQGGTLAVVRSIDDFGQLLPSLPLAQTGVTLRTSTQKLSDHVVACHQDVCVAQADTALLPVAGARVTILFVDQQTMQPCSPPAWLLEAQAKL